LTRALTILLVLLIAIPAHALTPCRVTRTSDDGAPTRVQCGAVEYRTLTDEEGRKAAAAVLDVPRLTLALTDETARADKADRVARDAVSALSAVRDEIEGWRLRDAAHVARADEMQTALLDLSGRLAGSYSVVELVVWCAGVGVTALLVGYVGGALTN